MFNRRESMFEIIKETIIKWDPIGLMGFAPLDEYDDECNLIFDAFIQKQGSLGQVIYDVFDNSFGESFRDDLSKCMEVGAEIELRLLNWNYTERHRKCDTTAFTKNMSETLKE